MCFQVQQNILLQAKQSAQPQPQATSQFSSQQDVPVDKVVIASSASAGTPAQLPSVLQPTSVLVKTPATGKTQFTRNDANWQDLNTPLSIFLCIDVFPLVLASSDLQVFSGAQGSAGAMVNQTVTPVSLTQPAQVGNIKKPIPPTTYSVVIMHCVLAVFYFFPTIQIWILK